MSFPIGSISQSTTAPIRATQSVEDQVANFLKQGQPIGTLLAGLHVIRVLQKEDNDTLSYDGIASIEKNCNQLWLIERSDQLITSEENNKWLVSLCWDLSQEQSEELNKSVREKLLTILFDEIAGEDKLSETSRKKINSIRSSASSKKNSGSWFSRLKEALFECIRELAIYSAFGERAAHWILETEKAERKACEYVMDQLVGQLVNIFAAALEHNTDTKTLNQSVSAQTQEKFKGTFPVTLPIVLENLDAHQLRKLESIDYFQPYATERLKALKEKEINDHLRKIGML